MGPEVTHQGQQDGELGGGEVGMALSIWQVWWVFACRRLSVSPRPCALLRGPHPEELPACTCNEVATGCWAGATEQSRDGSV